MLCCDFFRCIFPTARVIKAICKYNCSQKMQEEEEEEEAVW